MLFWYLCTNCIRIKKYPHGKCNSKEYKICIKRFHFAAREFSHGTDLELFRGVRISHAVLDISQIIFSRAFELTKVKTSLSNATLQYCLMRRTGNTYCQNMKMFTIGNPFSQQDPID